MHEKHEIIHRDIKPSNILFLNKNDLSSLKICDLGLSNKVGVGFYDQNDDNAGTLIYQPPEQIQSIAYGKKIDIWSTGIIMYEALTKGGHPELGANIYKQLDMSVEKFKLKMLECNTKYSMGEVIKSNIEQGQVLISEQALSLLEHLLQTNPNLRYSSITALKHPWITRDKNGVVPLNMYQEMQLNMAAYDKLKHLQKVMFAISVLKKDYIKGYTASQTRPKRERINTVSTVISIEHFTDVDNKEQHLSGYMSQNSSGGGSSNSNNLNSDTSHLSFLQSGRGIGSVSVKKNIKNNAHQTSNLKRKNIRIRHHKTVKKEAV